MDIEIPLYDIVIVGSGPAGVAAAITAMRAGLKLVLITAAADPAETTLTESADEPLESLHPGVEVILKQLGVEEVWKSAAKGHYDGISVNGIYTPLSTLPDETWTGVHISRNLFDSYLINFVKETAIAIRFNAVVNNLKVNEGPVVSVVLKSGEKIHCGFVIDCSGKRRIVGKRLNLKEYFLSPPLVCSTEIVHIENGDPLTAAFNSSAAGWTWLAGGPKGSCTQTKVAVKMKANSAKIKFANVRWRIFKPLAAPGYVLAGDAAGILDPAAGQGILIALMSGVMAADTVIKCKHTPAMGGWHLAHYHQWFTELFATKCEALKAQYLKLGIIFCAMFITLIY